MSPTKKATATTEIKPEPAELTESQKQANVLAAQSRVDNNLPPQPNDAKRLAEPAVDPAGVPAATPEATPAAEPETPAEETQGEQEPAHETEDEIDFGLDIPDGLNAEATAGVLVEVAQERIRQHEKWGEQTLRWGGGSEYWQRQARLAKEETDKNASAGTDTYLHVLKEEVFEAFAESDENLVAARAELVQVAAVAVSAIESIDRITAAAEAEAA